MDITLRELLQEIKWWFKHKWESYRNKHGDSKEINVCSIADTVNNTYFKDLEVKLWNGLSRASSILNEEVYNDIKNYVSEKVDEEDV